MMGGLPVGFGFIFLYNAANNYLVDTYQHQAASALAAKTFIRSFWGAGVVLFTVSALLKSYFPAMSDMGRVSRLQWLAVSPISTRPSSNETLEPDV